MAGRLYNRQGRNISMPTVQATIKEPTLEPVLSVIQKNAANIAQNNYALGQSIALQEAFENAYKAAPDSPEQFEKAATSAINSFSKNLPSNIKNNLQGNFDLLKSKYLAKVEENYYAKLNEEHKIIVGSSMKLAEADYSSQLDSLYKATISRDERNQKIAYDAFKNAVNKRKTLAGATDIYGNNIYTETEIKNAANDQKGHLEAFKNNIDTLSLKELKSFDSEVFQDRVLFEQRTGINRETYEDMDTYVKQRLKNLGDEEDRVLKNQATFEAVRLASTRDPARYKELKDSGIVPSSVFKALDKVYETAPSQSKVENAYLLEKTMDYLYNSLGAIQLGNTTQDDYENMTKALVKFGDTFKQFSDDNGLSQQEQQEVIDMATKYISDAEFREAMKPIFSDTAIAKRISLNSKDPIIKNMPGKSIKTPDVLVGTVIGNSKMAERYASEVAHEWVRQYALQAMAGNYTEALKILQQGNRAVIMAANSDKISEGEFARLENELVHKRPAIFEYNGRKYEFVGYSNNDAIFKIKG